MRTVYKIRCIDALVDKWGENGAEGSPFSKGGFDVGDDYATAKEAIQAAFNIVGYSGDFDAGMYEDGFLSVSVLENEHGYQDDNGGYLADYLFRLEKLIVSPVTVEELERV